MKPPHRVLLKISGESLCEPGGFGVSAGCVQPLAEEIHAAVAETGVELALVLGGGNFLRGKELAKQGLDRPTADGMGMLATIMNGLALRAGLESLGTDARVMSAVHVHDIAEPFVRRRCIRHLEKKRVVLLAGGTGHPYFTTDTTAALRALQIGADSIFKATKVDGIYSADPSSDSSAELYEKLTYLEVLQEQLGVMDAAAISLCMENDLPLRVFNMRVPGNIVKVLRGEPVGTLVY